jgi:hypothetical protein
LVAPVSLSRRTRLTIGAVIALVFAVVLIAPVLPTGGSGSTSSKPCALKLVYGGKAYVARAVSGRVTQTSAIGVGVASGCGVTPSDIGLRSIEGVLPAIAVGVGADATSLYVRRGVCRQSSPGALMACLRRSS